MPVGNTNIVCKTLMCSLLCVTCKVVCCQCLMKNGQNKMVDLWHCDNAGTFTTNSSCEQNLLKWGKKTCAASRTACKNYDFIYNIAVCKTGIWSR